MKLDFEVKKLGSMSTHLENWIKQADACWGKFYPNRPVFIVEVGLLESLRYLALDARGWLENHLSSAQVAITIGIHQDRPEIIIHQWKVIPRNYGIEAPASPHLARQTAVIKICRVDNITTVTGKSYHNGVAKTISQLKLPFHKIVTRPPSNSLEKDFIITEQELRHDSQDVWYAQGFV